VAEGSAPRPGTPLSPADAVPPARQASLPPPTDWLLLPFHRAGSRFAWLALGLGAFLALLFLGARIALDTPQHLIDYAYVDVLMAVLFAYLLGALTYLRRSVVGDFAELRPMLRGGEDRIGAALRAAVCPDRRLLFWAGLGMAALWGIGPAYDSTFWADGMPPPTAPIFLYACIRQAAMGFLIGRVLVAEGVSVLAYSRLGAMQVEVDLLDPAPLRVFARRGLRSGFVWVLCSSLVSLFWLGPGAASTNAPTIVAIGVLVLVAFFGCVSGVRQSIRRAKHERLAVLRSEIRRESETLLAPGADGGDARLANLVALQGLVERVPEWPFDAPVLLRAALIALLGLGSWLGGALVERLLDRALG